MPETMTSVNVPPVSTATLYIEERLLSGCHLSSRVVATVYLIPISKQKFMVEAPASGGGVRVVMVQTCTNFKEEV